MVMRDGQSLLNLLVETLSPIMLSSVGESSVISTNFHQRVKSKL